MDPARLPLRDIHLPEPIGWWPIAPGWWALLVFIVLLLAVGYWRRRYLKRSLAKRSALREFTNLKGNHDLSPQQQINALSALLRSINLSIYPRENVAALTGPGWLLHLDGLLRDGRFTEGAGKLLIDGPYRKGVDCDLETLFQLCEDWINALPRARK